MMMRNCINCNSSFVTENKRKIFCKDKCQRQHYRNSPKGKECAKKWASSIIGKAWWKEYKKTPVWIENNKKYEKSPKSKARIKRYQSSDKRRKAERKFFANNPEAKISRNLRRRLNKILHIQNVKKKNHLFDLIGCSAKELKKHLEQQFLEGMCWSNYGVHGWHIDHKYPCSKYDLSKKEEQQECFHYLNLRPCWAKENIKKSNKIIFERRNYA